MSLIGLATFRPTLWVVSDVGLSYGKSSGLAAQRGRFLSKGQAMTTHPQIHGPLGQKLVRALQKHQHAPVVNLREFAKAKAESQRLFDSLGDRQRFEGLDPVHALYASVQNIVSLLLEVLSQMPELEPLVKVIAQAEDEYMPEGPPMSPLTLSYFEMWATFDATVDSQRETLGTCLLDAGTALGMDPEFLRLVQVMQDSRMGLYVHQGVKGPTQVLRELLTGEEHPFVVPSEYIGHPGEVWLARTLPPPSTAFAHGIVFTTPYVMRGYGEPEWQDFLARTLPKVKALDKRSAYFELMKWGLSLRYWPEYIFEAYCGHEREVVYLTGLPDVPMSRPHSDESMEHSTSTPHGQRSHQGKKGQRSKAIPTGKERHRFALNPHSHARFTRCPLCEKPTKQRKFVLAINIQPGTLLAQGLTCRYCPGDDLIIAHKDVLESQLAVGIGHQKPDILGNDYLVLGTFERELWRQGLQGGGPPLEQMLPALHLFREVLELSPMQWGWYLDDKR